MSEKISDEVYELSSNQREMWMHREGIQHYYIQLTINITGELERSRFFAAIEGVVREHEVLRSRVVSRIHATFPMQLVSNLSLTDICETSIESKDFSVLLNDADQFLNRQYDPAIDSPIRCFLVNLGFSNSVLFVRVFSLWADSFSGVLLFREIIQNYNCQGVSTVEVLPHRNFAQWQNDMLREPDLESVAFWGQRRLQCRKGQIPFEMLSSAFVPGRRVIAELSGDDYETLRDIAQKDGLDLSVFCLAVFCRYLSDFGNREVNIGFVPPSRRYDQLSRTMGLVTKTIPLICDCSTHPSVQSIGNEISRSLDELDPWMDHFIPVKPTSERELFPYVMEWIDMTESAFPNFVDNGFRLSDLYSVTAPFVLKVIGIERKNGLSLHLYYDINAFSCSAVEVMTAQLSHQYKFGKLRMPSGGSTSLLEADLLRKFSVSSIASDTDVTIVSLFEKQSLKTPDSVALRSGDVLLTYSELNHRSNQLARYLRERYEMGPDVLAAVQLDRNSLLIVTILGILKSGGAYVPIDPNYPETAISHMMTDSGCRVLIDESEWKRFDEIRDAYTIENLPAFSRPQDLAYVIYTSGSTGRSKGVMINNRSVVDYVYGILERTNMAECRSFGFVSTVAADLGNTVIYASLLTGGELVVFSAADVLDATTMAAAKIDCLKIVPSHWKSLQASGLFFAPARCLIFGGESLTNDVVDILRLNNADCTVYNHYGPSETTIGKLVRKIDVKNPARVISLGAPFGNTRVYVLSPDGTQCPFGVPGEICIAGHGLARGYLKRPELTAEKFVISNHNPSELIYLTGDLGRWLPDGTIGFMGRKDDQVKIRGYRVEPLEVEVILQSNPLVSEAVVIGWENEGGEKELLAYVCPKAGATKAGLEVYLSIHLPIYMLPGRYMFVEKMPLTLNGKIDRKNLPKPSVNYAGIRHYVAPATAVEQKLALIWRDILAHEPVSAKDNFFELGGHSLRATKLAGLIAREFEVRLKLRDLFNKPVLEDQAALISRAKRTAFVAITVVESAPCYVLSSSQRRLWILSQFDNASVSYNIPVTYRLHGELRHEVLDSAFRCLIERHESLRTVFSENVSGELMQYVILSENVDFKVHFEDWRDCDFTLHDLKMFVQRQQDERFNLSIGPLIRACLIQLGESEWLFSFVMHHIVSDGWSMGVLVRDLLAYYYGFTGESTNMLVPLRIQYKDYAAWQQENLKTSAMLEHKEYWLAQLNGQLPVLDIPTDRGRPATKSYKGGSVRFIIETEVTLGLKAIIQREGGSLFMGLLTVLNVLLYRYSEQSDLIVGSPVAGREHVDLDDQIGFFVNTLPLRSKFRGNEDFYILLSNVRQITLDAYDHQQYPFDELIGELSLRRDMGRNPLFDVMILLQNAENYPALWQQGKGQLAVSGYEEEEHRGSKFDLLFAFVERGEELYLDLEYNSDIFDRETVSTIAGRFGQLMKEIVADPSRPISEYDISLSGEKSFLLKVSAGLSHDFPSEQTLLGLFEEQVSVRSESIAMVVEGKEYSYRELFDRSTRLGAYLCVHYGVGHGDRVGVCLSPGVEMIISLLAVLRCGAAYVPIDPEFPLSRMEYIISDSGSRVVIDASEFMKWERSGNDPATEGWRGMGSVAGRSTDLVYVMYTSGSTGQPKGCMLEHRGVINRLAWMWSEYGFTSSDVILQKTSFTFDVSVVELFLPLCWGARMVVCPRSDAGSPERILSLIEQEGVTYTHFVPGMLDAFIAGVLDREDIGERLKRLRCVVTSGEALTAATVKNWYDKLEIPLHNLYGPTEASIEVTAYTTRPGSTKVPIGRPIWNTQIYILGTGDQLVPQGIAGEICIGGVGLARGYYNQPELTASKFIMNPFAAGGKLYRTGDRGRWLADGNIEYLGRNDEQVKIRGYRIEPGEIENHLQSHPHVSSAVVTSHAIGNGNSQLIAYLITKSAVNLLALKTFLQSCLPAYMVPGRYIRIEKWPVAASGKIDRRALHPGLGEELSTGVDHEPARSETEKTLIMMCQEIIGVKRVGVRDNFFDIGGHSLLAIQFLAKIHSTFGVRINIQSIFHYPTVQDLAIQIDFLGKQIKLSKERDKFIQFDI